MTLIGDKAYFPEGTPVGDGVQIANATSRSGIATATMIAESEARSHALTQRLFGQYVNAAVNNNQLMWDIYEQQREDNMQRVPMVRDQVLGTAINTANQLSDIDRREFYRNLENIIPDWQSLYVDAANANQGDANRIQASFDSVIAGRLQDFQDQATRTQISYLQNRMTGALDADEYNQMRRQVAETARSRGIRGQAAENMQAVAHAGASLSAKDQASQLMNQTISNWMGSYNQALAATESAASQVQGNVQLASQFSGPMTNYSGMYNTLFAQGNNMGVATAGGLLNNTMSAYQTAGQLLGAATSTANNVYSNATSQANAQILARNQAEANKSNGLGTLLGTGLGVGLSLLIPGAGVAGAALGASVGGSFGNAMGGLF
jgi:hypothetical protein